MNKDERARTSKSMPAALHQPRKVQFWKADLPRVPNSLPTVKEVTDCRIRIWYLIRTSYSTFILLSENISDLSGSLRKLEG
jgi:hypothetical protein